MRCHRYEKDVFIHVLSTDKVHNQGLIHDKGYMVEVSGTGCLIDQEYEDLNMLYKMYVAYMGSQLHTLKHCPQYYVQIEYQEGMLFLSVCQYVTNQVDALDTARTRGLDYIYTVHGNDYIYTKQQGVH